MKLSSAVLGMIGAVVQADDHGGIMLYGSCVKDIQSSRVLPHRLMESLPFPIIVHPIRVKSVEECTAGCRSMKRHDNPNTFGYSYAGIENQNECWCGDEPENGFSFVWSDQCNMKCIGDYADWQNCGGSDALNIWSVLPQVIDGICVDDAPRDRRVLNGGALRNIKVENLTPQVCSDICFEQDFQYYGVEYGDSCYCGDHVDRALRTSQPKECSKPCIGDKTQICGGDFKMNLYGPICFNITPNSVVFQHAVVHRWFELRIDLYLNNNTLDSEANIFGVQVKNEPYKSIGSQIPALFLQPSSMDLKVCMQVDGETLCKSFDDPITPNKWVFLWFEQWCWFEDEDYTCSFYVVKDLTVQWYWSNAKPITFTKVEGVIGNTYGDEKIAVASGKYKNFKLNQYEARKMPSATLRAAIGLSHDHLGLAANA